MSHSYLIIRTEWVPDWTKQNVPTYPLARFNNDGSKIIIDNAHPVSTFLRWLGQCPDPDGALQFMLMNSEHVTPEKFREMQSDPDSEWFLEAAE